MIIGMIPMALGLGDGGEQNAPLGRAVIGGLLFATVATLFFVPTVFSIIHGRASTAPDFTLWRLPMAEECPGTDTILRRTSAPLRADPADRRAVLAIWGEVSRMLARSALAKETAEAAIPTVLTTTPNRTTLGEELVLPGTVQAYVEAPIYARTSGYLKEWRTDIGAHVPRASCWPKSTTPEVDQQLSQAQADLATARANESLSKAPTCAGRDCWPPNRCPSRTPMKRRAMQRRKRRRRIRRQPMCRDRAELESFKRVVAPFGGVITARNTDIGALINAGQSAGTELFRIADMHKLRIYVQVPETYAAVTRPGLEAELRFAEQPKKGFTAKTVRTSNALDPNLRTLQVELELDNADHEVFPGAYAEVHFKLPASAETLRLPANTVLFRAAGLQVATVDGQRHVKLKSIVQGRDFGNTIEILSGLESSEVVILNPSDSLTDGTEVRIASAGKAAT